jgi:ATP-binding cassette, subfamily A (ABC1), member 3
MLTGLFKPTSGTAYIYGKDIQTDLKSIQSSLGFCPQHNVLFNELTVKEHITFFSKLKGMKSQSDIDEQIRKYVDLLELQPKLNAQSKTLSGGMKRKLSIGVALCGDSKIVMCDEPTSGMVSLNNLLSIYLIIDMRIE